MNQIIPFNFDGKQIRTVVIENKPYFVGKDITSVLGYSNSSKAILDHVDVDDKLNNESLSSLGQRDGWIITESGVYSLIMSSKLPTAKRFKHWVTSEILPSIRKEGAYVTPQTAYEWMADPDNMIKFLEKYKSAQQEVQRLHDENTVLQPKADYTDQMLANPGLEATSVIAKNYGYSTREFNKLLHGLGIQYKQGKTWLLYATYQGKGYTHIEPFPYKDSHGLEQVRNTMKWTQAGQRFLYDFLKSKGIVPKVEQITQEA